MDIHVFIFSPPVTMTASFPMATRQVARLPINHHRNRCGSNPSYAQKRKSKVKRPTLHDPPCTVVNVCLGRKRRGKTPSTGYLIHKLTSFGSRETGSTLDARFGRIPRQEFSTWRTDCVGSVHANPWMVVVAFCFGDLVRCATKAGAYIIVTGVVYPSWRLIMEY